MSCDMSYAMLLSTTTAKSFTVSHAGVGKGQETVGWDGRDVVGRYLINDSKTGF